MKADFNLDKKRVLVTGGASGIGLATVQTFLRCGARVALNDLETSPNLEDTIARLRSEGHDVFSVPGDVGKSDGAADMVAKAIDILGGLDFLINNAATPGTTSTIPPADFEAQSEEFWDLLLNVNLKGPFRCTKAAANALKESSGSIVNTASIAAMGGGGSSSVYCATKAGLISLTREWARALAPQVRVNAIAPGYVDSNWMCRFEDDDDILTSSMRDVPLGRIGTPEDYAEVILFLAAGADYVTGQTLVVDGGLTI